MKICLSLTKLKIIYWNIVFLGFWFRFPNIFWLKIGWVSFALAFYIIYNISLSGRVELSQVMTVVSTIFRTNLYFPFAQFSSIY